MQDLSSAFSEGERKPSASSINKSLGCRLSQVLNWTPDRFRNGFPNWASFLVECWKPNGRECEWVLVPPLREIFRPSLAAMDWVTRLVDECRFEI
jgi:hypothetical protein